MKTLNNNKGEFTLRGFVISLIVFSVFILGSTFMITDLNNNYDDVNISTDEFSDTYDVINDTYGLSQDTNDKVLNAEIQGGEESIDSTVKGGYGALRLIRGTFSLVSAIINDISENLNIPTFMVQAAITALTIMIIFGIIYMIFKFRG
jgi:hypothetical protein